MPGEKIGSKKDANLLIPQRHEHRVEILRCLLVGVNLVGLVVILANLADYFSFHLDRVDRGLEGW